MRLTSFSLNKYKRFQTLNKINFDSKLMAIIGSNEAGKTSLLNALEHLNHTNPFGNGPDNRELSRDEHVPENTNIISAVFLLDSSDIEALQSVHGGDKARWFVVNKRSAGGTFYCNVMPRPTRDLAQRKAIEKQLRTASVRRGFQQRADEHEDDRLREQLSRVLSVLSTGANTLSQDSMDELQSFIETFDLVISDDEPKYLKTLLDQLRDLERFETGDPNLEAIEILINRIPRILLFTEDDRSLRSNYSLSQAASDAPKALANLVQVAKLNLMELHYAVQQSDHTKVRTVLSHANRVLSDAFSESWTQSSLSVSFAVEGDLLLVHIEEYGEFSSIDERSDGLRQFIALLAFATLKQAQRDSVLLIDELETHLHYDAQADLVQILARQEIASQVIYTTHSIGCLPEDLGTGIRLIETANGEGKPSSQIENCFWSSNKPGFSPLLFGMGANTLAFLPVRNAVICEGISDIILWPTLLREAANLSHLGFQMAPGLSSADKERITIIDHEAPQTIYLVDADDGGRELARKIKKSGVPESRILKVPDRGGQGLTLEDLVSEEIYVRAVNEELRKSHGTEYRLSLRDLSASNRPKAIANWCKEKDISIPSKRAVAYQIVSLSTEHAILDSKYKKDLKALCETIKSILSASQNQSLN